MNQTSHQEMDRERVSELMQKIRCYGSILRFPFYLSSEMMKSDLEELELSVRSVNCLKRAGYHTIGQLVEGISGSQDLKKIRNCGRKSVSEIMSSLFFYQCENLSPGQQEAFLRRVYFLSTHPEAAGKETEGGDFR